MAAAAPIPLLNNSLKREKPLPHSAYKPTRGLHQMRATPPSHPVSLASPYLSTTTIHPTTASERDFALRLHADHAPPAAAPSLQPANLATDGQCHVLIYHIYPQYIQPSPPPKQSNHDNRLAGPGPREHYPTHMPSMIEFGC